MSRGQTLRALVNERLAAAAEEIFVLFERTIAEYEEELCRCNEENQRNQQLLDKYSRMELIRENVQIPSMMPGTSLNQETTETPWIKEELEEQSVEQEEEQLPVSISESSAVCVKTEESSLLQQRQTEHREETQGEDISSETEGHTEHFSDPDNDQWEPFSCTAAVNTGLFPKYKSAPETTVHSGHMSAADGKKFQCTICNKRFSAKRNLTIHIRVHTGEKPFGCSFCQKTFAQKCNLDLHVRSHTGERPYSCTLCPKAFLQQAHLKAHMNVHRRQRV